MSDNLYSCSKFYRRAKYFR